MSLRPRSQWLRSITASRRSYTSQYDKFKFYEGLPVPPSKLGFIPESGTYPDDFTVGSLYSGIKSAGNGQPDLVLVHSDRAASCAAVFSKNRFCAPSVTVSRDLLRRKHGQGIRGVIANSGCANMLNGEAGVEDAIEMSRCASSGEILVMHTGRGGVPLPMHGIREGLARMPQAMGSTHDHWLQAAVGLCTTDTFPKLVSRSFSLPSSSTTYSIAAITKGAGMIHPNMATTLGIICTDAAVSPVVLQTLLSYAAARTYNCISIDGDTSTNDMVAMFANGRQHIIDDTSSQDFAAFQDILHSFMAEMAQLVVRDAEGATKFITIRIRGCPDRKAAKLVAQAIAKSSLLKAGFYGEDPGWIGVLAAVGYALADTPYAHLVEPEKVSLDFAHGSHMVSFYKQGTAVAVDDAIVQDIMRKEDLEIVVGIGADTSTIDDAVFWTCDIAHDFITLNSGVPR